MAGKNTAVFGIYPNRTAAEEAIGHLRSAGFRPTDPSVLVPENQGTKDLAHVKNTKAPEGLAAGAIIGAILGAVFGYLLSAGNLNIPALAAYVAGPVITTLAGVGALGVIGGIIGALFGLAFPEYEARRFEGRIRYGGVLLSVHCDNHEWCKRAKNVLLETGAQGVASEGEKAGDFANADKPGPRVRNVEEPAVPEHEPILAGAPQPRPTAPPPSSPGNVAGRDDMYTERIVRRRTIQDPDNR